MILSRIQGGLGNQMFQWAYGRNLSIKYNREYVYEDSFYFQQGDVNRKFELKNFNIPLMNLTHEKLQSFRLKEVQNINDLNIYNEVNLLPDFNYYLNGYWQSEMFFKENKEQVRKDFSYASDSINDFLIKNHFENQVTVSLHIRRGDYVDAIDMYPLQTIDYYKKALELIGTYDTIIVFSDDIEWCKNNLPFERIIFSEGFTNVEDLTLMSKCNHNIIANSSFSWWGAYLNNNPHKKIIAPKKWYGSKMNIDTKDLLPESWIKI